MYLLNLKSRLPGPHLLIVSKMGHVRSVNIWWQLIGENDQEPLVPCLPTVIIVTLFVIKWFAMVIMCDVNLHSMKKIIFKFFTFKYIAW